jgi:hypothetical protein
MDIPAFELPAELANADTIGIIYDETDGLNFCNEYRMLRDLFADPALTADKRYSQVLRGYLGADSIGPLPFLRLAAAFPQAADAVLRNFLRKPDFTWAVHGEATAAPPEVLVLRARTAPGHLGDRHPPDRARRDCNLS